MDWRYRHTGEPAGTFERLRPVIPHVRCDTATVRWIAWAVWLVAALAVLLGIVLNRLNRAVIGPDYQVPMLEPGAALVVTLFGILIISRHPKHPIGWILLVPASFGPLFLAHEYGTYALQVRGGQLPCGEWAFWVASWLWVPGIFALNFLLPLLFPTGHLPSKRWQIALALVGLLFLSKIAEAIAPGPMIEYPGVINPLGVQAVEQLLPILAISESLWLPTLLLCAVAPFVRFRHAEGDERQQLKWYMLFSIVLAAFLVAAPYLSEEANNLLNLVMVVSGTAATAVAIFKYRLYDIDLLANRMLVYGSLTAILVALYLLVAGGLGGLLQSQEDPLVSLLGAGLVAVLFAPLRDHLQRGVDRLMYGERDEPYAVLSRLGRHLEGTLAPEAVLPSVVQTVREALRLPYAAIGFSHGDGLKITASAGEPVPQLLRLPLVHRGEQVGELLLGHRAGEESFSPADRRLLEDLARQAGAAVHAVRLTADLQRSREQLVTAREEERRRIRHDLHDGLGPALASMSLQLAAARNLVADSPEAAELLATLKGQMHDAVADIRRVVYALRPPVLDELGLVEAIGEYAARYPARGSRADLHATVEAPERLPPLPAAVEVAAYRIALEALTNVARHSGARSCAVRLSIADGALRIEVADDGRGVDPNVRAGTGLISMRERAQELGGTFEIELRPSGGTTVRASLPLGGTDE